MGRTRRVVRNVSLCLGLGLISLIVTDARSEGGPEGVNPSVTGQMLTDLGSKLPMLASSPSAGRSLVGIADRNTDMRNAPPRQKLVSVLVHLRDPALSRSRAIAAARRRDVKAWAGNVGGFVQYEYKSVLPNVINLRNVPASRIAVLKVMPGVEMVEEDRLMHASLTVSTPMIRALQSQITGAGLSADGTGVRVCIIDTGIDSDHIMFSSRIDTAAGRDFVNNDNNPEDDNGHGSNVAGIALGGTGISVTRCTVSSPLQGVAPNATLIGVKVLDQNGSGSFSNVIAGIDYCADQTASGGRADVINMSLGAGQFTTACDSDSAAAAANNAVNNGVVVVAAAGNDGFSNAMGTPACGSKVIAVGAVYDDNFPNCEFPNQNGFTWCLNSFCTSTCTDNGPAADSLVCFSDQSDMLDVTAPGCELTSADNAPGGTSVSAVCGTSQATPHVAGLAALILSADPTLTPTEVRQIIRDGAIDLGPAGFDRGYGWGRIDAINSLQLVAPPGCSINPDCDDGVFCNGAETCVAGTCQPGTAVNCDDGVTCTTDSCNEAAAACDNIPSDAACDDGLFCNGTETCDPILDCQAGVAVNCNDGVTCTTDSCNEGTNSCDNVPSNGLCDDGVFCNGSETCDPVLDCQAGTAVNCDDGVGCTDDSCNETTNSCDNATNNANCDDGLFCNGAETCDAGLDCQAGSNPCPGQLCDEATNTCFDCNIDADCDDGVFCNGAETCVAGACQSGTTVNCNDGVVCTTDSCNEGTNSCDNAPSDAACDNGLFCDGAETCDAVLDCQAGVAVNCDDGVGCTTDSCNEGTNSCDNVPSNGLCDDGVFCNGSETCHATLDCQAGTPPTCDDGVACTDDTCNTITDVCDNTPNDANCDDGLFCNGAETCDALVDCQAGGDPCPGQGCDEATNTCTAGPVAQLEAGTVTVGGANVTVNLTNNYVSAVVACTIQYVNNTSPVVTRVTNVTSSSFDVRLQNPSGSAVVSETVNWIVVEEGSWTIDGVNIDAQTYLSTVTDDAPSTWIGQAQAYGQAFTSPVVLGQVMSDNDPDWTVFWNKGSAVGNPPSATTIVTGKTVCEDTIIARVDETVGFIVIESGHGTIGGVEFEASLGTDTVQGIDNAPPYAYTFNTAFAAAPQVRIANMAAVDGNNGGWAYIHGATGASATQLFVSIDEDQIGDTERWHTTEQVGYLVFAGAVVFPAAPQCTIPADCDDGLFCNGVEDCVAGTCVAGTAVNCNDGVACTVDTCNEGTASCDNVANNANCDDGLFCNGAETCDAVLDCQAGTAVNCDDGVACTNDSCNEGTNSCDNVASNANCDDGLFCNGTESCDPVLDCQAGTAVNCNDGVACTDDSCNEATNSCDNVVNNANCDDGLFCNGTETCDAVLDCQSGVSPCNDGVACTDDTCDEALNSCSSTPNNVNCDDGLFCNGAETCDALLDCQAGADPCPGQSCDEVGNTCITGPIAKLESGSVTVGSGIVTVSLTNAYVSPVVVCSVQYSNNTTPVVTRVSNVTTSSFDVRLQNPSGGAIVSENVSYLVVEEGIWTIDGVAIEAQTYLSTVTDQNNSWVAEAQTYGQTYTNPVVLGQVMTENDANWSVFWDQGTSRTAPPSATSLRTGKTVCEDTIVARADETVGFIVFEAGHGFIAGVEFEAALGADTVLGVTNGAPITYTFNTAFASAPQIAVTTQAAMDGGNGGWAQTHGATLATSTSFFLSIDEDQIGDTERNHITEQVAYVVFATPVVSP